MYMVILFNSMVPIFLSFYTTKEIVSTRLTGHKNKGKKELCRISEYKFIKLAIHFDFVYILSF